MKLLGWLATLSYPSSPVATSEPTEVVTQDINFEPKKLTLRNIAITISTLKILHPEFFLKIILKTHQKRMHVVPFDCAITKPLKKHP